MTIHVCTSRYFYIFAVIRFIAVCLGVMYITMPEQVTQIAGIIFKAVLKDIFVGT